MTGHIAGAPIEETIAGLAPLAAVAGALVAARLRHAIRSLPRHLARPGRPERTA